MKRCECKNGIKEATVKKFLLTLVVSLILLFGGVMLAACGGEDEKTVAKVEIGSTPTKTEYLVDEAFDISGGSFTVTYEDGNSVTVAMTAEMCGEADTSTCGEKQVTVTYAEGYSVQVKYTVIFSVNSNEFVKLSASLPMLNTVTLGDADKIIAAEAAWNALTDAERGYPEAAIRWIDALYDLDAPYGLWAVIGMEGEEWEWIDEEKTEWKSKISDHDYSKVMATTIIQTGDGMPYAVDEGFWSKQQTLNDTYTRPLRNQQMQYGKVGYPYVYFSPKELKEISGLAADINSYINRFISSAISTDGYIAKNWDDFTQFRRLQLDRYLELLQIKYDEFYS